MDKSKILMGRDGVIPMLAGPVSVPEAILNVMHHDYDAGHTEEEFFYLYQETSAKLAKLLGTKNDVLIMSGEGMLVLWGALKSSLQAGDKVLCIDTGVFGGGFAPMAKSIGAEARTVSFAPSSTINQAGALERIEEAIKSFSPKMITVVHCETPSGTLNPLKELGAIKKRLGVPLLCVDAVSSVGGAPVDADECHCDIVMGASQKCLSVPPCMAFASVSPRAWDEINKIGYQGYDAFAPFSSPQEGEIFPYTPYRHGTEALNLAADIILQEGLTQCFARHEAVARLCRDGVKKLGLELFAEEDAISSPTVTAVRVPERFTWQKWHQRLVQSGLLVGGSFGPMAGKVFRLGHMGTQANLGLMERSLAAIATAL